MAVILGRATDGASKVTQLARIKRQQRKSEKFQTFN
jgi:hypothetical protein